MNKKLLQLQTVNSCSDQSSKNTHNHTS